MIYTETHKYTETRSYWNTQIYRNTPILKHTNIQKHAYTETHKYTETRSYWNIQIYRNMLILKHTNIQKHAHTETHKYTETRSYWNTKQTCPTGKGQQASLQGKQQKSGLTWYCDPGTRSLMVSVSSVGRRLTWEATIRSSGSVGLVRLTSRQRTIWNVYID